MKLFYSFIGLCAMFAVPAFAQDEVDVTSFIKNPGFDEDLTWQADGTMKEIVNKDEVLSNRSDAWVAADGTCYCHTDSKSANWKRTGDSWAINGFIGQVDGWTLESNKSTSAPYKASSPEWVYFGTVAYGVGATAIPVADDGTTYLTVPEKPEECNTDDNVGFAYLRAGWGGKAVYKQVVSLPCAQYRLDYWIYNLNFAGSQNNANVKNLCKVTCRRDVFPDDEGFAAEAWTKHSIEFTPTADFTIEFGFESAGGSNTNPFVCIDGIKLYRIGDADPEQLLQTDIADLCTDIETLASESLSDYPSLMSEIEEKITDFNDIATMSDLAEMEQAVKDAKAYIEKLNECIASIEAFGSVMDKAVELLEAAEYPGVEELNDAIANATDTLSEGTMEQIMALSDVLNKAIEDYYYSQEASVESPANFTFLVNNPTFAEQGTWYIGQDGGDQTIKTDKTDNDGNVINCWNAWRNNLEIGNSVSISQDITGLKNGKYMLQADINTQNGCITDQHIFANGTAQNAVSPVMTVTGWDPCVWETLTTAPVIVIDGKLTIGAIGNGDGQIPADFGGTDTDKRRGWFNLTNVKLLYAGEVTAEEIAAVVAEKFNAAQAMADTMHLAADKATFAAAIVKAKAESDLDSLNAAIAIAEASENEYRGVMGGTYKTIQDSIAKVSSSSFARVTKPVVDITTNYINSAEATYAKTGEYTNVLRFYLNNLTPAIAEAEKAEEKVVNEAGKAAIKATIDDVVAKCSAITTLPATAIFDEDIAALKKAVSIASIVDIAIVDGSDLTAYIANPTVDDDKATGWTVKKIVGDGNGAKTGQEYNGGNGYYIDTYNSTAGTLRATWYQVLDVPNGTYTVSNMMRSSGNHAYLFASDKAPVTVGDAISIDTDANTVVSEAHASEVNLTKYVNGDLASEQGGDSITVKTDTHGEIWIAAAERVMSAMGVSGAVGETNVYELIVEANGSDECPAAVTDADWAIFKANGGLGRGWTNNSVSIEVKDHVLVLGVTCDYAFLNKTEEDAFTGTWFSADNFVLTLTKAGDNTGWNAAVGIDEAEVADATVKAVYTISGSCVAGMQKGINIVKMSDGSVKKVLVK